MCGRYAIALEPELLAEALEAELATDELPRSVNLAPTMPAPILVERERRKLGTATFGLVPFSASAAGAPKRFINARSETLTTTSAFREAAARRRCLVPAEGFYEWQGEGRAKQPFYIHASDGSLLTFAGVFAVERHAPPGPGRTSFAIVTRPSAGVVAPLHDRMPLIVPPSLREAWLRADDVDAPSALASVLAADAVDLEAYPVSTRVNDPRALDASIRDRIAPGGGR